MKIQTSFAISILSIIGALTFITACESPARLASKVEGSWSSVPQRFDKETVGDGTYTPIYEFTRADKRPEGDLILSAQVSVTMPVNAPTDSLGQTPVSATAAALATVRGIWIADDEDDIKIALDPSTLTVTMDPDVQFEIADLFTSYDTDSVATVPTPVMKSFQEQIRKGMNDVIARTTELKDIDFKGDAMMTCKIDREKYTLSRSTPN